MFKKHTVFKAFSLIAFLTIVSKLLGFIREAIIAYYFGATIAADLFYIALIIPTIAFTVIGSTIKGRVIPLYIEKLRINTQEALTTIKGFIQFFLLIAISITILLILTIKPVIYLISPGFNSYQSDIAIILTLIIVPIIIIMTMTSITQVIFHAHESFTVPAVGPLINNITVITFIFILYPLFDLYSLAVAVLIGSIFQLIYQWLLLPERTNYLKGWKINEVKKALAFLKPVIPIIIAAFALQLNTLVDRVIASFLESGSIAALNYSYRLLWIPLSILLIPITTVIYPKLSHALQNQLKQYERIMTHGLVMLIVLSIPFSIVMLFESRNLVSIVYERGEFDLTATIYTSGAFIFYTLGLLFIATREYLAQHFYVIKKYTIIMYGSIYGVLINIIASISLAPFFSINGIAFATTLSMIFQTLFFYFYLSRDYNINISSILFRGIIGGAITIGVVYSTKDLYVHTYKLVSLSITTAIVFIGFYYIMRKHILNTIKHLKGI